MKTFLYQVALFFQGMGFVTCQSMGVPTYNLKRKMVNTRNKMKAQPGYRRKVLNRKQMHK